MREDTLVWNLLNFRLMQYLLDSNICVYLIRQSLPKSKSILNKINAIGWDNCCISEYTMAELYYGAFCSNDIDGNIHLINSLTKDFRIIPISSIHLEFAKQKALLRKKGCMIEDADIFIGATATANNMVMVTENMNHMSRLEGIVIDNWCSGAELLN